MLIYTPTGPSSGTQDSRPRSPKTFPPRNNKRPCWRHYQNTGAKIRKNTQFITIPQMPLDYQGKV